MGVAGSTGSADRCNIIWFGFVWFALSEMVAVIQTLLLLFAPPIRVTMKESVKCNIRCIQYTVYDDE